MDRAYFRFYDDLTDFLPYARRGGAFTHEFEGRVSIKDMIESLGVPHTEVDLILVNGESVDFTYLVADGDRISVYPIFETLDITPVSRVRPAPLDEYRFVLDVHLGKLAAYLRLLGFDALLPDDHDDANLARIARDEGRILLTRDRGLLKRSMVTYGYCPRSTDSRQQLVEVLRRFDLFGKIDPFQRCLRCNGRLEPVDKDAVADRLPPRTREHYDEFRQCRSCGQVYWQGAHYERLRRFVEEARQSANGGGPPT